MSVAGFTFDSIDPGSADYGNLLLVNKRVALVPAERRRSLSAGARPGSWDFGNELDERRLELDVASGPNTDLSGTDVQMQALATLFDPTNEVAGDKAFKALVFDSTPDRYYLAKLVGDPIPSYLPAAATLTLPFRCRDPFAYSVLAFSHQTGAGVATIGIPAAGNYKTPPVIAITAAAPYTGNVVITNSATGEVLTWNGTLGATDILSTDTTVLRVYKNGAVSMAGVAAGSVWPYLLPGAVAYNTITVTGIPAGSITKIVVTWSDRWI